MISEGKLSRSVPGQGRGRVIQTEFSKKNSTFYVGDGCKAGSIPDVLYRLLVPGILFIVFLILAVFPSHSATSASRIVRVGVYQNPPKVFINEQGEPDGFFVDLIEQIAEEEGWTLDFVPCDWETCLFKLREHEIDLMTDVAYTPERDILFDFHRIPAAESWSRVYANPKTRINRIDQLNDKTLAVLKGSIQESIVGKTMAGYGFNVTIVTAPNLVEVFKLVQSGSAQAAVVNHFFGDYYYEDYGLTRTSVIINATTLYYATSYGINQDLLSAIDKHLAVWLDNPNSVYYTILNRWLDKSSGRKWLTYLTWGIVAITGLLLITSIWIMILRKQVRERTRHLETANQRLSENEEKYRLISTVTSDYMFSSRINSEGNLELTWVAGAFEAMTGYTLREYIANGGWRATLYPEDYPLDDEDMELLKANQNIVREIRTRSKNGSTSWVMVYAHPTWDTESNKLIGIFGAVQDITARKNVELKLEYANSLLNLTGKIAHVGGWEYNIRTEEIEGTDEMYEIYELDHGRIHSLQEAIEFFAPEAREQILNAIQECLTNGTPWDLELPFITAKGNKKWVCTQGMLEQKENKPIRLLGAFQDITERKAIEEDIHRQTSHANALVRTAAHISSRLDLDAVLKAVCVETATALSVPAVVVYMVDTQTKIISIVADYGLPDQVRDRKSDTYLDEYPDGFSPTSDEPVLIHDLQTMPDMPNAELFESMNMRTKLMVKIQEKGNYIGNLAIYSIREVRNFTDEEIDLLQSVANQAAQAITNAHLFKDVEKQLRNIESLHTIDSAIANSMDVRLALKVVAEETIQRLGVDAVDILLYKSVVNQLESAVSLGFRTDAMKKVVLRMGEGFAGQIATDWQSIFVQDMKDYRESFIRAPEFSGENFVSYAGVPLRAKGQLIGVLEVFNRKTLNPDQEWFVFLETLAGQAAIAIESIRSFEEIQISNAKLVLAYDATIEGWSRAMDLRDKETEGHTQRVTELTIQMAHELEIPDQQIVHIRRGALLHDMGKLGIPDQVLLKPGPLTDEEWVIMRKHPQYAYDMLSSIDYLRPALDIPYCHHEKWDGSGYPRGLKGEQIPIAARIFSIIDVWDALTSDRPYRPAWDRQRVIEYIENNSGKHFDPEIAKVFLHKITRDLDFFKGD